MSGAHHTRHYSGPDGQLGLAVCGQVERDILSAEKLGLKTFHIVDEFAVRSGLDAGSGGNLADLRLWLESTDPASLNPSFKSVDSLQGILSATPAVLNGLSYGLASSVWNNKPAPDDWSLTELICHLRDTEREIHHMQIKLFKEQSEPFIPRPDTSVWASQRDYLHEDGNSALKEFNDARRETLIVA